MAIDSGYKAEAVVIPAEHRWVCAVCGYVHQGTETPGCCPICGATPDLFELHPHTAPHDELIDFDQWTCLNCDYIHLGADPPLTCPVCGLPSDQFKPGRFIPAVTASSEEVLAIVIVGAGIAGVSAAESIRNASPSAVITVLSKEPELPYYRLNLTRYIAGELTVGNLNIHPQQWYQDNDINLCLATELRELDPDSKCLTLSDDQTLSYDRLILAMGAHPFVPPIPGIHRENVTTLRTIRDADAIIAQCRPGLPCAIIGGGVLGLETAGALVRRGVAVTLLEGFGWLMPLQLNQAAGKLLAGYAVGLGITVRTNVKIAQIDGDDRVRSIVLEGGESIPAELVIVTAGVRSNSWLLRRADIDVNQGVLVTDTLQTSREELFAAGDLAEHRGISYGTWAPAQFQGVIAGLNAIGKKTEFAGIPRSNTLKVLGLELYSIGLVQTKDGSYQSFELQNNGQYFHFMFHDGQLVGAILLGDMKLAAAIKNLIEKKSSCTDLLHSRPDVHEVITFIENS
ncbi:MAG TPA: FAD-dependent oxidoreductase [Desulfuromonadales bacterium]|nr:FAD-dependent oxidoreductase [Desulfuromonadales bacterium]